MIQSAFTPPAVHPPLRPSVQPPQRFAPAGTTLYRTGDPARALFTLRQGVVKLAAMTPSGNEHILMLCGTGDVLGGAALTQPHRHDEDAVALTDIFYSVVPSKQAEARSDFAARFAAQWRRSQANLALAYAPVTIRLAATLVELSERFGEPHSATLDHLTLPLRHEDYAAAVHATRVAVSMAFAALREAGAVQGQRGDYLLETATLRSVAQSWEV